MTGYTPDEIGRVCHAANTELQRISGDPSPSAPWDAEPPDIRQVTVAGVEAVLRGATPQELHEEWVRNKVAGGWMWGQVKDRLGKTHPAMVPYADLPGHQRVRDAVFLAVVTAMSGDDDGPQCPGRVTG